MGNGVACAAHVDSCPFKFFHHRVQGAGHVGAGVAVGHGVHVEAVNAFHVGAQRGAKRNQGFAQGLGA